MKPNRTLVSEENVIVQVDGLILSSTADAVRIRLDEYEIVVHFPLHTVDKEVIEPGTHITYKIIERKDGSRYQKFDKRYVEVDQRRVNEITDILAKIVFRGER